MKTVWLGNLKNEQRDAFRQSILQSKIVLDKLREIVYNKVKEAESVSIADYDAPSWSHKQAHTNGYNNALREILELLDIKDANTHG